MTEDTKPGKSRRRTFLKASAGALGLLGCGDDSGGMDARSFDGSLPDGGDAGAGLDARTDVLEGDAGELDGGPGVYNGSAPVLSNFRIMAAQPSRLYFDSSESITGTADGFVISGREIDSLVLNGASRADHYFAVATPFTFWDNTTIRYEAGDVADLEANPMYGFTLEYVRNEIPEPEASDYRYVEAGASGGDGSIGSPWSLAEGFANAVGGMTVWIKAGDYGDQYNVIYNSGTASSPVKFIGYKTAIGDITSNYISGYDDIKNNWSVDEMPTLTGVIGTSDRAFNLQTGSYFIMKNFQVKNFDSVLTAVGEDRSFMVLQNINGKDLGTGNYDGAFIATSKFSGEYPSPYTGNTNIRLIDCVSLNVSMTAIAIYGQGGNLIDGCKSYNDGTLGGGSQDYHIATNGHHNIMRNCHVRHYGGRAHSHGLGIRGDVNLSNTYNLIERSTADNMVEAIYIRNTGCDYNVIKDCQIYNTDRAEYYLTEQTTAGITIWGGADYNIVERVYVHQNNRGIYFYDLQEEEGVTDMEIGRNNLIRNCVIHKAGVCVYTESAENSEYAVLENTKIVNCTFSEAAYFYKEYDTNVMGFDVINCNITNVGTAVDATAYETTLDDLTFSNCNFYNSWGTEVGEGNISLDPNYADPTSEDFRLLPGSANIGAGQVSTLAPFDFFKNYRGSANDIGHAKHTPE